MPLSVTVKAPNGDSHEIRVTYNKEDEEFQLELVDHKDPDYDMLMASMGDEECKCYLYERVFSRGFYNVLNTDVYRIRESFLEAIGKQGPESLGLTQNEFGEIVVRFMTGEETYSWIDVDMEDFLIDLETYIHWVGKTPAFWQERHDFIRTIYEGHVNTDVIDPLFKLLEIGNRKHQSLVTIQDRLDSEDNGEGHSETEVTFFLKVGDTIVSEWSVIYNAYFDDIERMNWNVEWRSGEQSISEDDENFMHAAGLDWDEIRDAAAPEEPDLPSPDSDGEWSIWHDDNIYERYSSERDARSVFDAMVDAVKWVGFGSNVDIKLMRVREDLEDDADLDNQENWEEEDSY